MYTTLRLFACFIPCSPIAMVIISVNCFRVNSFSNKATICYNLLGVTVGAHTVHAEPVNSKILHEKTEK